MKCINFLLVGVLLMGLWNCKKKNPPDPTPPTVEITSPVVQNDVPLLRIINLSANASAGGNKKIASVEFFADDVLLPNGKVTNPPYNLTWECTDKFGQRRVIKAVVTDDAGFTASDTISFTVFNGIEKAKMPGARYAFTANAVNGKIYVVGGFNNDNTAFKVVQEYDPAANTWTTKAQPVRGHAAHASCVVNNLLYVFGGDRGFGFIDTVEAYNPATNTWAVKASILMDSGMSLVMGTAAEANGKVYLMGGLATRDPVVVGEYDPVLDKWRATNSYSRRFNAEAVSINNTIYYVGGCPVRSIAFCDNESDSLLAYNPTTDTWTARKNMLTGHSGQAATVYNNKIYVFGGTKNSITPNRVIEVYDPVTNTWTNRPPLPFDMLNGACVTVGNKIYLITTDEHVYEYTPD